MSLPPPSSSLLDGPHITAGPGSIQSASQHHVAAPGSLYQHLLKQPLSHTKQSEESDYVFEADYEGINESLTVIPTGKGNIKGLNNYGPI
ncbi:hypothetical protein RUM44_003203 [Polyplax serrata]